ncbi:hypothetical protein DXN05_16610 [Deminuibacter soli]|uniref:Outer membrane protein beta-barrel domain-containing protein n=1 Tax=Deminuibacter soli TaxID=2291815 RepID=A0A3E1NH11_9BACT|nr:hypothetical protein DXN05_16610 [Deminuibacter soli]
MVLLLSIVAVISFGQDSGKSAKQIKKEQRRERINQLMKQEEEGALIYNKQGAFGIKLNTDGYGIFYEHGKYKTIDKTNLWWIELGERRNQKESRVTTQYQDASGYVIGNSYIFGKQNNFYYLKAGLGQQLLIGGKGNKNGVAVSAIYGAGLTAGLLKPYYLKVLTGPGGQEQTVKYSGDKDTVFTDPTIIAGSAGFFKGIGETKIVAGAHARVALRFDYGRYNELLSAIEVGVNAEYYTQKMPILILVPAKQFFFNGYVALVFGKRK